MHEGANMQGATLDLLWTGSTITGNKYARTEVNDDVKTALLSYGGTIINTGSLKGPAVASCGKISHSVDLSGTV